MNPTQIAQIVSGLAAVATQASAPQSPGWKTSEFWLHLLSLVPMGLGVALGASNPITLGVGGIAVLGSSIYTACRSNIKTSGVAVAAQAAQAAADAINKVAAAAPVVTPPAA